MKLNEYQQAAVTEPPKNITVSAAAGSGKTQVLGARVLERISGRDSVGVNRLLIVTFTRAAAAEMRERISRSITDRIKTETDPKSKSRLKKQLSLLGGADICTIDSFCNRVLRRYFYRIPGLSGDFTVGDEGAVRLLSARCFKEVTEMFAAAADVLCGKELIPHYRELADRFFEMYPKDKAEKVAEGFRCLMMNYGSAKKAEEYTGAGNNRSAGYADFVFKLRDMALSMPNGDRWLDMCVKDYDPKTPLCETRTEQYAAAAAAGILDDMIYMLEQELKSGLNEKNTASFMLAAERLREIKRPGGFDEAAEMFLQKPLAGINIQSADTSKAKGDPHAGKVMKAARDMWNEGGKIFNGKKGDTLAFRKEIYPVVLALCELTRCLIELETRQSIKEKRLGFSTCVNLTLQLLVGEDGSPTETALELRDCYDEIYVDEAQDIDPRQQAIFEALSKGNLFMVGDVKQSIYTFRHAEPEIFNRRCFDKEGRLITMNLNYRSNRAVIDAVNSVFSGLMNKRSAGVDYNELHRMIHAESWLPDENPKAELIVAMDVQKGVKKYDSEVEFQMIANEINRLLREKTEVYDKELGIKRPIKKKDIIILMRSVNKEGAMLEKTLEKNNIACYFVGGEGLYFKEEISAVTDVLSVIDNPKRDIPLAGMLRSLMFGFSENDLLKIRAADKELSFGSVFAALSDEADPDHQKLADALSDKELLCRCIEVGRCLKRWRSAADFRPVSEVITLIINDTRYYASVGALPGGERRRANLCLLTDEAERFEERGSRGLYSFLGYIKKQTPGKGNSTEAKTLSDSMDVVRIMSIHKSKGLEAPVVILAQCTKPVQRKSVPCPVNAQLGFGVDFISEERGFIHKSPMSAVIAFANREKEIMEEVRLLYVAMTRPRERLIFTGYCKNRSVMDDAVALGGEPSVSEITFMRRSFADMLGDCVGSDVISLRTVDAAQIAPPQITDMLLGAKALKESVAENFSDLLGIGCEHKKNSRLPAKLSVSAIKEADSDAMATKAVYDKGVRPVLRRPSFVSEGEISGAKLGTVYHSVMENLDFSLPVEEQIAEMEKNGIIPQGAAVSAEKIKKLTQSPLGRRMSAAKTLFREAPFMIKLPAKDILPLVEEQSDEEIAVQGIIDCYFIEEDKIVIVDYKTDKYNEPREIAEKYKKQLYFYSKALKTKFFDKKIEKYLYLFHKGDIIEV